MADEPKVGADQDLTPHSSAEADVEGSSAGGGTTLADIAAALRGAGVSRTSDERGFTRDAMSQFRDVDIGMDEALRFLTVNRMAGITELSNVLGAVQGFRAQNAALGDNYQEQTNRFWSGLSKANGVFNNGLLQNVSIETDNEVITTMALAKTLENLNSRLTVIEDAIVKAGA